MLLGDVMAYLCRIDFIPQRAFFKTGDAVQKQNNFSLQQNVHLKNYNANLTPPSALLQTGL